MPALAGAVEVATSWTLPSWPSCWTVSKSGSGFQKPGVPGPCCGACLRGQGRRALAAAPVAATTPTSTTMPKARLLRRLIRPREHRHGLQHHKPRNDARRSGELDRHHAPPPGAFAALALPPPASAACLTIARPSPEPGKPARLLRAVEAVEHMRRSLSAKPGPWSRTVRRPVSQLDLDRAVGRAPLAGVVDHVGDRAGDTVGRAVDRRSVRASTSKVSSGRGAARASTASRTIASSSIGSSARSASIRARARRRRRRAGSARRARRGSPAGALALVLGGSRSASRKIWMLLRSAAIGVRSSCEASATGGAGRRPSAPARRACG